MSAAQHPFDERFPGDEFDWFARDAEGSIGLFSTGGFGPVPLNVQLHFQHHDRAAFSIELPHIGSLDVWKDFAKHGLYVFDWQAHTGPYKKMKHPEGEMPSALQHDIIQIVDLPYFNGVFRQVDGIVVGKSDELMTA